MSGFFSLNLSRTLKSKKKGSEKTSVTHSVMKTLEFTTVADLCQPIQETILPQCSRRNINLSKYTINISQYHQHVGYVTAILADITEFSTL